MRASSPFDHERDPELGGLLRAHLEGADHRGFVSRVLAATRLATPADSWDILARWLYPGMAAAAALGAAVGLWSNTRGAPRPIDTARVESVAPWLASEAPLSRDLVMSVVLEGP